MALNQTERVLLAGVLMDCTIAVPLVAIGFLSGSASATTEAIRTMLLVSIDVFSISIMLAINRRRFTRFEFGLEKLQIMVQIVIAVSMSITMIYVFGKIWRQMTEPVPMPVYIYCLVFAGFSFINMTINIVMLRGLLRELQSNPSLILRGQIKNRSIMLISSVVATLASACVIFPDRVVFETIDTVGAVIVFCVILYTVVRLLGGGLLTLLDAPIEEAEKLGIYREVVAHYDAWEELAFLRTRRVGHQKYVEVGLVFDGNQPLERSLEVCRRIEVAVREKVDNVMIAVRPTDTRTEVMA